VEDLGLRPAAARFVLTVAHRQSEWHLRSSRASSCSSCAGVRRGAFTGQQVQVVLMAMLVGIGTAGVPGGSLPLVAVIAQSVGAGGGHRADPGVDRLLDMCRTVLNVTGDLVVAACVAGTAGTTASDG